jgi:VWFA-related protein
MLRFSLVAALACGLPLFAQAPLSETIEVRIINVDVVVTDREGTPVRGLKAEDFSVWEDGEPRTVTNLAEYGAPPPQLAEMDVSGATVSVDGAQTPMPRHLIIFVDRFGLAKRQRQEVFSALDDFLREAMRPGDKAMLVTYDTSMKVHVPFTDDQQRIRKEIAKLEANKTQVWGDGDELAEVEQAERMFASDEDGGKAAVGMTTYQLAQRAWVRMRNRVRNLNALMSSVAGLEGRKMLLLVSEKFERNPGMKYFLPRDPETGVEPTESKEFNAVLLLRSFTQSANAHGVAVYPIHPGGLKGKIDAVENRGGTATVREYILFMNDGSASERIAQETGGLYALGSSETSKMLPAVLRDLDSYYSLGFRAVGPPAPGVRDIKVKVRNPEYRVRYRREFVQKSDHDLMEDRVIANLAQPIANSGLQIEVKAQPARGASFSKALVPIEIRIPVKELTTLPSDQGQVGSFSVYIASSDAKGGLSDVVRQTQKFTIDNAKVKSRTSSHFTYEVQVRVRDQGGLISVGVVDDVGKVYGFGTVPLAAARPMPGPMPIPTRRGRFQ